MRTFDACGYRVHALSIGGWLATGACAKAGLAQRVPIAAQTLSRAHHIAMQYIDRRRIGQAIRVEPHCGGPLREVSFGVGFAGESNTAQG
jgi:hypothetical protein